MPSRRLPRVLLGCLLAAGAALACAQQPGIYTCVDGKGHRLTSDRPIPECLDREQKELNSNGTVRRTVGPSLTASERAELEEKQRKEAEERQKQAEEHRAEKALLNRYPNQASHDAERAKALANAQDVVAAAQRRLADLQVERRKVMQETEFYKSPKQWPPKLKRQVDDIDQQIAGQQRFLANQEDERKRINARFDEELARLKVLWAQLAQAASSAAASSPARKP